MTNRLCEVESMCTLPAGYGNANLTVLVLALNIIFILTFVNMIGQTVFSVSYFNISG